MDMTYQLERKAFSASFIVPEQYCHKDINKKKSVAEAKVRGLNKSGLWHSKAAITSTSRNKARKNYVNSTEISLNL